MIAFLEKANAWSDCIGKELGEGVPHHLTCIGKRMEKSDDWDLPRYCHLCLLRALYAYLWIFNIAILHMKIRGSKSQTSSLPCLNIACLERAFTSTRYCQPMISTTSAKRGNTSQGLGQITYDLIFKHPGRLKFCCLCWKLDSVADGMWPK